MSAIVYVSNYLDIGARSTPQGLARMQSASLSRMAHHLAVPGQRTAAGPNPEDGTVPLRAAHFAYSNTTDYCTDIALDLLVCPTSLSGTTCRPCASNRRADGSPRAPTVHHWDGDAPGTHNCAPAGALHYVSCPFGLLAQHAHSPHNAVQRVFTDLLRLAYGSANVSSTYGANSGPSAAYSTDHAPDILVRNAANNGQPLLVEIRTIAVEAACHLRSMGPAADAPHVARLRDTVLKDYKSLQNVQGKLCVAVVDLRGGLGGGTTVPNVFQRGTSAIRHGSWARLTSSTPALPASPPLAPLAPVPRDPRMPASTNASSANTGINALQWPAVRR